VRERKEAMEADPAEESFDLVVLGIGAAGFGSR
jgi:hypothetical protein